MDRRAGVRRDVIRAVVERARVSGDRVAPWRHTVALEQDTVAQADVLVGLHREWLRLLVGRLHRDGIVSRRTPTAVRELHDEVGRENPTIRGLLDAHAAHPALWEPTAGEHTMLARLAGLASHDTSPELAAAQGRTLLRQRIPAQRAPGAGCAGPGHDPSGIG